MTRTFSAIEVPSQNPNSRQVIFKSPPTDIDRSQLSCYGDDAWFLWPMANKATTGSLKVDFTTVPKCYRTTARRVVWSTINERTPMDALTRTSSVRDRPSGATVAAAFVNQRTFFEWLEARGVFELRAVTNVDFRAYADYVCDRKASRHRKHQMLFSVSRIWLIAPYLPMEDQLHRPTWEEQSDPDDSLHSLLGPMPSYAENSTAPIHPQSMSALFLAALRVVEVFGPDILAALGDRQAMQASIPAFADPEQKGRVKKYLKDLDDCGGALPGTSMTGRRLKDSSKELTLAAEYLAATLGVSRGCVRKLGDRTLRLGTPMPTPITGQVDGESWCEAIDFYEVAFLRNYLMTACFVVVSYLSGMRSEECRALERGCCVRAEVEPGIPDHFEIHGVSFKGARDDEGNTIPGGQQREHPWLAVEPVSKAIALAESVHEAKYVFTDAYFRTRAGGSADKPISTELAGDCVERFVRWWNTYCRKHKRDHESIPADPEGAITPMRFRRTLAWFIYRIPGGRIALGLQYGHLRAVTSDGYGSRVAHSVRDVFMAEEALAAADTLQDAAQRVETGEHVSGPAAARYTNGALTFRREFEGTFLTLGQMAALRRNPAFRIYDNAERAMACVYDQATALCHPERDRGRTIDPTRTPDLTRCRDNCANRARTDTHAEQLKSEIERLRAEAASPLTPDPIGRRLRARIHHLEHELELHKRQRKGVR